MSRQLKGLLFFQMVNGKHTFTIFWSILIGTSFISFLIAALTMTGGDNAMIMFFSIATYIYAMFIGFQRVKEDVIYSLKMGATRKNIFISTGLFFLGLSLISALLISALHRLILFLTSTFQIDSYQSMHFSFFLDDTWFHRILIDTSFMFLFLTLLFLFGLLFYRYGLVGAGSIVAVLIILSLVLLGTGWLQDAFQHLMKTLSVTTFFEVLAVGFVLYGSSWLFLRRITILMRK